jgi:hypothetical protein
MDWLLLFAGAVGLGAAHAFEPDHMAAVSTFVAKKPSPRDGLKFGVNWALGHGLSLLVFGSVLYALRRILEHQQPLLFSSGVLDRFVGVILVGLGLWTLLQLRVGEMHHSHHHTHDGEYSHTHEDGTTHTHSHSHGGGIGSLLMGMMHGAAGTGAFVVQAANAGSARSYWMVAAFTLFFSVGVTLSMGLYAGALGGAITLGGKRAASFLTVARGITGVSASVVGACMLLDVEIPWIHFV